MKSVLDRNSVLFNLMGSLMITSLISKQQKMQLKRKSTQNLIMVKKILKNLLKRTSKNTTL